MASPDMQRDILLGQVALELNFVNADTLSAAMEAWNGQNSKSLGQVLVDRQAITPHTLGVLENLVQLQLGQDASEEAEKVHNAGDATVTEQVAVMTPPVDASMEAAPSV